MANWKCRNPTSDRTSTGICKVFSKMIVHRGTSSVDELTFLEAISNVLLELVDQSSHVLFFCSQLYLTVKKITKYHVILKKIYYEFCLHCQERKHRTYCLTIHHIIFYHLNTMTLAGFVFYWLKLICRWMLWGFNCINKLHWWELSLWYHF